MPVTVDYYMTLNSPWTYVGSALFAEIARLTTLRGFSGFAVWGRRRRTTASPLCVFHHDEYHRHGRQTWETKHSTHRSHLQTTRKRLELPAFDDSV
jgi:hypothetical protein